MLQKKLTPQQALQKVKQFCSYQERSHFETGQKLFGFGLNKSEVEAILSDLIDENYLNEERFSILFAGGKFRIKKWGRIRITYELKQKRVSDYCIKKAIQSIDQDEYEITLLKLASDKWSSLNEDLYHTKIEKISRYLQSKGYETDLIHISINKIKNT